MISWFMKSKIVLGLHFGNREGWHDKNMDEVFIIWSFFVFSDHIFSAGSFCNNVDFK